MVKMMKAFLTSVLIGVLSSGCVSSTPTEVTPAPITGEIIGINHEYNFMVLNIGRKHGVTTSSIFVVEPEAKTHGRIRVSQVEEMRSVAERIDRWYMYKSIVEGDPVKEITQLDEAAP